MNAMVSFPDLMRISSRFVVAALSIVATLSLPMPSAQGESPSAEAIDSGALDFFETKIRPVLVKECYRCHSSESGNAKGGLRLDTRELSLIGGDSGPAIVPGDLDESALWAAINFDSSEMPPRGKLPQPTLDDFRHWIETGAPDPRQTPISVIRSSITAEDIEQAQQNFWAYQSPVQPNPPSVQATQWPLGAIDRFVLAQLEHENLRPAPDANSQSLLRRLSFDLIGLPPTRSQQQAFDDLWEDSPGNAIAITADQLLSSDQFGERWGRHWLDVARYAESSGRAVNMTYPHAWRYRDFVIDSFNNDQPFHQFVQQQIAGDLLPADSEEAWTENLIATTFLAMGPKNLNEPNPAQFAADLVDEQIDVTTRVFLGQSVACARCHDHKFDAIPQTDYYALAGVFAGMKSYFGNPPSDFGTIRTPRIRRNSSLLLLPIDDPSPFDRRYSASDLEKMRGEMQTMKAKLAAMGRGDSRRDRIRQTNLMAILGAKLAVVDANGNPRSYCMGVQAPETPSNVRVLARGEIDAPGQTVPRGFPQVLCSAPAPIKDRSSGRLELARWIGSDANPLTARVQVNRIWQKLLGQGLVSTPENFGATGRAPSHPPLLDHLAVGFMQNDWSTKTIIRDIVTSRTYRMSSTFDQQHFDADPENQWLWRFSPRRLDAEALRDAMLQAAGRMDTTRPRGSEVAAAGYLQVRGGVLGDPREMIRQKMTQMKNQRDQRSNTKSRQAARKKMAASIAKINQQLDMEDATYRSVYLPVVRDELARSMEVFDFANPNAVTGMRESSNTANQALYMMNNAFVIAQSDALAHRITQQHHQPSEQVTAAFQIIFSRRPTASEHRSVASFARSFDRDNTPQEALSAICQSLFASAEFRYLD